MPAIVHVSPHYIDDSLPPFLQATISVVGPARVVLSPSAYFTPGLKLKLPGHASAIRTRPATLVSSDLTLSASRPTHTLSDIAA